MSKNFASGHEITPKIYAEVAERLAERIRNRSFYSGIIGFTLQDIEYRLAATLFIRRSKQCSERGIIEVIERLIPVWWEFHTIEGGTELCNDFDFKELTSLIEQQ